MLQHNAVFRFGAEERHTNSEVSRNIHSRDHQRYVCVARHSGSRVRALRRRRQSAAAAAWRLGGGLTRGGRGRARGRHGPRRNAVRRDRKTRHERHNEEERHERDEHCGADERRGHAQRQWAARRRVLRQNERGLQLQLRVRAVEALLPHCRRRRALKLLQLRTTLQEEVSRWAAGDGIGVGVGVGVGVREIGGRESLQLVVRRQLERRVETVELRWRRRHRRHRDRAFGQRQSSERQRTQRFRTLRTI